MLKKDLRHKYKVLRQQLKPQDLEDLSLAIANRLLKLDIWDYDFYHLFLSIQSQKEINTDYILNILSGKDKHIIISKSDFKTNTLSNYLLTDSTTIKLNTYNIPEPIDGISINNDKIDVVFVPLLAFDLKGNRVGYGKGFYDHFLASCKSNTLKIGLSFFEAEDIINDVSKKDILLNYCITPKRTYKF